MTRRVSRSTGAQSLANWWMTSSMPGARRGRALMGLHFSIWGLGSPIGSLRESIARLRQHPALAAELRELFDVLDDQADHLPEPLDEHMRWAHRVPLAVHSRASLDEIMAAFGRMTFERPHRLREGVSIRFCDEERLVVCHPGEGRAPLFPFNHVPGLCDRPDHVSLAVAVDNVGRISDRPEVSPSSTRMGPTCCYSVAIASTRPDEPRRTRSLALQTMSHTKGAARSRLPGGCGSLCRTTSSARPK